MDFLITLSMIVLLLVVFALGPVAAMLHALVRADWQPVSGRNVRWGVVVMLIPLAWIAYFVVHHRRPVFDDDDF